MERSCGIFFFFYYYCIYGRKGCFHPLTPIDTIRKKFKHNVIFREEITFKHWFSFGNQSLFPGGFVLYVLEDESFSFANTARPRELNPIFFTSKKQSHSTSYCWPDHENSGMSFVNKVLCLDCWLCLCGCGCGGAPKM